MVRKLIVPMLAVLLLSGYIFAPVPSLANSELDRINAQLAELQRSKAESERIQREAKAALDALQRDRNREKLELNEVNRQLGEVGRQLAALETRIEQVKAELTEAGNQLEQAIERVAARDQLLKSKIRLMYTNGSVSYAEVLLSATSFTDFLDRMEALQAIIGQDQEILDHNKKDRDLIAAKKVQVEVQLADVRKMHEQSVQLRQTLLVREKEKEVAIASIAQKEELQRELSAEEEKRLQEIIKKESALEREKASFTAIYKGGKIAYPLPREYPLTSGFGGRVDPISGKMGTFHNGIDIGAPGGTDVLAAEGGVVILAQWYGGYGETVIIEHGGGLQTLYAHMRTGTITVNKGSKVARGDKLGAVGTTGYSTGNHLHFTVYKDGEPVNPISYLR